MNNEHENKESIVTDDSGNILTSEEAVKIMDAYAQAREEWWI